MKKNLKMHTMKLKSRLTILSALIVLLTIQSAEAQDSNRSFNYTNEGGFFSASFELPKFKKDIDTLLINKSIKNEFDLVIKKYEDYFKKYRIESSSLVIIVDYKLDSVYYFKENVILLYNVYQENIPPYSKSHSMQTIVYDKFSGNKKTLNLGDFVKCKNGLVIPISKVVNSKIQYIDCKLIESDKFFLKYFIPIEDYKILIPVWDELGKNSKSCMKKYESLKIVFEKKELEAILKELNY